MGIKRPSLEELRAVYLANIEQALNVKTPDNEKAYNKVIASAEAALASLIYSYCISQAKESYVRTASRQGLIVMGEGYGVYAQDASSWQGKLEFLMSPMQKLPLSTVFVSASGNKYSTGQDFFADDLGVARPIVNAVISGAESNAAIGDRFDLQVPAQGAASYAIVSDVLSLGANEEDTEVFRRRLLDIQQSERGSANAGDYRVWAQSVKGVKRAYPFTGRPVDMQGNSLPLETTTYIECTEDIDAEGVPPQSLLDLVKESLVADPDTGESRLVIGHTSDTIFVRPIVRIGIYISIFGLTISQGDIAAVKQEIKTACDVKLRSIEPYVAGLDPEYNRNEDITESILIDLFNN